MGAHVCRCVVRALQSDSASGSGESIDSQEDEDDDGSDGPVESDIEVVDFD